MAELFCFLSIRVVPNASRNEVVGWMEDGLLKVKVQAPPEGGRANREVCSLIASQLGLGKSAVKVEKGEKSRQKTLRIEGMDTDVLHARLGF